MINKPLPGIQFPYPGPLGNDAMRYSTTDMAQASLATGTLTHLLPVGVPKEEGIRFNIFGGLTLRPFI